jgi:hypothetical protein
MLQFSSYKLQVISYKLQVISYKLQVTIPDVDQVGDLPLVADCVKGVSADVEVSVEVGEAEIEFGFGFGFIGSVETEEDLRVALRVEQVCDVFGEHESVKMIIMCYQLDIIISIKTF